MCSSIYLDDELETEEEGHDDEAPREHTLERLKPVGNSSPHRHDSTLHQE